MATLQGVWKRDPRGVDYISFSVPDVSDDKTLEMEFKTPKRKESVKVVINNDVEILGIIVLCKPDYEEK